MNEKFVEFVHYCQFCKHRKVSESEEPCNECLTTPARLDSHKPLNYSPDKDLANEDAQEWRNGR